MPDATLIQIIIQGGAVGLLAVLFFFLYKFGMKALSMIESILTNHLSHLPDAADGLNANVTRLMDRIDMYLFAHPPAPPTSSSDEPSSSSSDEADPSSE